jgi:hypothetical protein
VCSSKQAIEWDRAGAPGFKAKSRVLYPISICLIAATLLTGCPVVMPWPARGLISGKGKISKETLRDLSTRATTREKVLLRLGAPSWDDDRILVYEWTTQTHCIATALVVPIPGPPVIGAPTGTQCWATRDQVCFQFDSTSHLRRLEHLDSGYSAPQPTACGWLHGDEDLCVGRYEARSCAEKKYIWSSSPSRIEGQRP